MGFGGNELEDGVAGNIERDGESQKCVPHARIISSANGRSVWGEQTYDEGRDATDRRWSVLSGGGGA
jgi:hypothetical protein